MKYNELFDANGIFIQTEHYLLRRLFPEDKPYYQQLAKTETPNFLQKTGRSKRSPSRISFPCKQTAAHRPFLF